MLGGPQAETASWRLLRSAAMPAAEHARASASVHAWRPRRVMASQSCTAAASSGLPVCGSLQTQMRATAAIRTMWSHIRPAQHRQRHSSNMHLAGQPLYLIPSMDICNELF